MISQLKALGLADKEAKVYIAMLELGPAPVLDIAAKARVNRPTAYVQIESLKKRGLVSTVTRGKKQYFQAGNPDELQVIVNHEMAEAQHKKNLLGDILSDLRSMYSLAEEKPQVRFFEGKEGLLSVQREFLTCKTKKIYGIWNDDEIRGIFSPEEIAEYSKARVAKGIFAYGIYTSSKGAYIQHDDKNIIRELRYMDPKKFNFSADITIFDNKVAITAVTGKLSSTVIEQTAIADSFREIFRLAWEFAEK